MLRNSRSHHSILNGHPGPVLPGVQIATGPMGQGFGVAQGFAIAGKLAPYFDSYVMTGDGELQEGPIWEAVFTAFNWQVHVLVEEIGECAVALGAVTDDGSGAAVARSESKCFEGCVYAAGGGSDPTATLSRSAPHRAQNTAFKLICMLRAGWVPLIWPAVAAPIDAFGFEKFTWLKALNISHRNVSRARSATLKLRCIPRSVLKKPGP